MAGNLIIFNVDAKALAPAVAAAVQLLRDYLAPGHARRMAAAAVDVERLEGHRRLIASENDYSVASLKMRAEIRLAEQVVRDQENMERIAALAIPDLSESGEAGNVEPDWLRHFFDRARTVSNEEMQRLWAKVLAAELNETSSISRKTVEVVASLDKHDAQRFTDLCSFVWVLEGAPTAFIYDPMQEILGLKRLQYADVLNLGDLGLLRVQFVGGSAFIASPPANHPLKCEYFGQSFRLTVPTLPLTYGRVSLTQAGAELYRVAGGVPHIEYQAMIKLHWQRIGYLLTPDIISG